MVISDVDRHPRVLLSLPQFSRDPASGAARTMITVCEMLATNGFTVRVLETTASEGADIVIDSHLLAAMGIEERATRSARGTASLRFMQRGVEHIALNVCDADIATWREAYGPAYSALYEEELHEFRPHIVFTFGGHKDDLRHRRWARASQCRVIFGLYNVNYFSRSPFADVDYVLTPSHYLSRHYRDLLGLESTPLPTPLHLDEVLAPNREPRYVTMVNPSIGKGAMLLARLAEELGTRFPDIPLQVFESRGTRRLLFQAGFVAGFDLRRHSTVSLQPATPSPLHIFSRTRVLLVPSVIEEASSRVVAEALMNGIPVIVSDRGGLPENCAEGGFVVPLPEAHTMRIRRPVDAPVVEPWLDVIVPLFRSEAAYRGASQRAQRAARRYCPNTVALLYVDFFRQALRGAVLTKSL
jgi:hypothetical protein